MNIYPASLVEIGYLSFAQTNLLLSQDNYQQKIANALYLGAEHYFNNQV